MSEETTQDTPPKINIEPENDGLEGDFPFPGVPYSQVNHVNLPGCTPHVFVFLPAFQVISLDECLENKSTR